MEELVASLKNLQANSVVFYSTAQGFHWNVEGPLFTQYHEFFKEIYSDVYGSLDTVAEWIRKFDTPAPYSLQDFISAQTYGDVQLDSNSPIVMSRQLLLMNDAMIEKIKEMFDIPGIQKEQGLLNFLAERQDRHQFWGWQLRSSLKSTVN
jgi:starvation-inducible DNA-binding protein